MTTDNADDPSDTQINPAYFSKIQDLSSRNRVEGRLQRICFALYIVNNYSNNGHKAEISKEMLTAKSELEDKLLDITNIPQEKLPKTIADLYEKAKDSGIIALYLRVEERLTRRY